MEIRTIHQPITATNGNRLTGYAAIYDSPAMIRDNSGQQFREIIRPGAFDVAGLDLKCFFNHNRDELLGRMSSGTLKVSTDSTGLRFDVTLPEYAKGKLVELVSRGDIRGCSFAFDPTRTKDKWTMIEGMPTRELLQIAVDEVSIVIDPAYQATSVSVRSCIPDDVLRSLDYFQKRLYLIEKM